MAVSTMSEGGRIAEARIGLTNVGTTPIRARSVEAALVGAADAAAIAAASESAADGTAPTTDIHADAEYRNHLTRVLTKRAVQKASGL